MTDGWSWVINYDPRRYFRAVLNTTQDRVRLATTALRRTLWTFTHTRLRHDLLAPATAAATLDLCFGFDLFCALGGGPLVVRLCGWCSALAWRSRSSDLAACDQPSAPYPLCGFLPW